MGFLERKCDMKAGSAEPLAPQRASCVPKGALGLHPAAFGDRGHPLLCLQPLSSSAVREVQPGQGSAQYFCLLFTSP